MTHRGPFQPLLFCDSVINCPRISLDILDILIKVELLSMIFFHFVNVNSKYCSNIKDILSL